MATYMTMHQSRESWWLSIEIGGRAETRVCFDFLRYILAILE